MFMTILFHIEVPQFGEAAQGRREAQEVGVVRARPVGACASQALNPFRRIRALARRLRRSIACRLHFSRKRALYL